MPDHPQALDGGRASLSRNAVECLPAGALEEAISRAGKEGRRLRVKLGIDPTAPDIHLGHAVVLRKLREFQNEGHTVVLIIGDYTARVGDPSGRSVLRPMLTEAEIEANAKTFAEQAELILDGDPERLELRRNSEWLDMGASGLLELMRTSTVAQVIEREDFSQRMAGGQPISMLELVYPLLQGYDSVVVDADVEVGGTDQKFNLLLARDIQRAYGKREQAVMTLPLLVGIDGERKMSKSLGNHIGLTEGADEIYGKTMRIPDEAMDEYYALLLDSRAPAGMVPRDAKRALAWGLVRWLRGEEAADAAQARFDTVFVDHGIPDGVSELVVEPTDGVVHLPAVMAQAFGMSRSQARRLIEQGGVSLASGPAHGAGADADGERGQQDDETIGGGETMGGDETMGGGEVDDEVVRELDVEPGNVDGRVLKVGKRQFVKVRVA